MAGMKTTMPGAAAKPPGAVTAGTQLNLLPQGAKKPAPAPAPKPKYGQTNMDDILAAADKIAANRSRFTPKQEGEHLVRVLPPGPEQTNGFRSFGLHYDPSLLPGCVELGDRQAILCVKLTYGDDCPLCRIVERIFTKAKAQANPDTKKQLFTMAGKGKARLRFVVNIIWCDQPNRGVLTWEMNDETFGVLGTLYRRWGMVDDPTDGQVLSLNYKRKGDFNIATGPSPTGDKSPIPFAGWADHLHDLDAYVQARYVDPKEIIALIAGQLHPQHHQAAAEPELAEEVPTEDLATGETPTEAADDMSAILEELEAS